MYEYNCTGVNVTLVKYFDINVNMRRTYVFKFPEETK